MNYFTILTKRINDIQNDLEWYYVATKTYNCDSCGGIITSSRTLMQHFIIKINVFANDDLFYLNEISDKLVKQKASFRLLLKYP